MVRIFIAHPGNARHYLSINERMRDLAGAYIDFVFTLDHRGKASSRPPMDDAYSGRVDRSVIETFIGASVPDHSLEEAFARVREPIVRIAQMKIMSAEAVASHPVRITSEDLVSPAS
jgi:hypothetical protein